MLACLSIVTALFVINLITYEISETEWKKYIVSHMVHMIWVIKKTNTTTIFQLSLVDHSKRMRNTPSGSSDTQELEYNEYTRFVFSWEMYQTVMIQDFRNERMCSRERKTLSRTRSYGVTPRRSQFLPSRNNSISG